MFRGYTPEWLKAKQINGIAEKFAVNSDKSRDIFCRKHLTMCSIPDIKTAYEAGQTSDKSKKIKWLRTVHCRQDCKAAILFFVIAFLAREMQMKKYRRAKKKNALVQKKNAEWIDFYDQIGR